LLCSTFIRYLRNKRKGRKDRKKVKIAWEIYKTGDFNTTAWEDDKLIFLGDVKRPTAIGKKKDLWANLDSDFYDILELWRWHRAGLLKIASLPYEKAVGIRYLIEVDFAENRVL